MNDSDFLRWVAARLDRIEGHEQGTTASGVDYCMKLRELANEIDARNAAAAKALMAHRDVDPDLPGPL